MPNFMVDLCDADRSPHEFESPKMGLLVAMALVPGQLAAMRSCCGSVAGESLFIVFILSMLPYYPQAYRCPTGGPPRV